MTFQQLNLATPLLKALQTQGYTQPTPIQEQAIPLLLQGRDLLGCAQTGTGKTAAFALPILQHLYLDKNRDARQRKIKALVVTPTRELAIQIADSFTAYSAGTNINNAVIFGGIKQHSQTETLRQGIDILVATPGRLLDLMNQGFISLKHIEYFVLDEADQMLDMGFIHDIRKLLTKLPTKRQSLFFSATMPQTIVELSQKILNNPHSITIQPQQTTAERVEQAVYFVDKNDKNKLLTHLFTSQTVASSLVFSRTKHGADKIVKMLAKADIIAEAIHGNKSQNARQRALNNFKEGRTKILVATDIAARGIDIDNLALVVNFDLPNIAETYVHRIGRTGRASASGIAVSFCDREERAFLKDIQKLIRQDIPVVANHPFVDDGRSRPAEEAEPEAPRNTNNRSNDRSRNNDRSSAKTKPRRSEVAPSPTPKARRPRPKNKV